MTQPRQPATVAVNAGRPSQPGDPLNQPITPVSTYLAGGDSHYHRDATMPEHAFETVLGALEGGAALAVSSGQAAAGVIFDMLHVGAVVVAPLASYSGIQARLDELDFTGRIRLRRVDTADSAALAIACEGAQLLWLETPSNPLMEVTDIAMAAEIAHSAGALVAVDNTFATPILQRPLESGADFVIHSATKYLGGHSDLLLGAIVASDEDYVADFRTRRAQYGATCGALELFLAARGIRTLAIRMERHQSNAQALLDRLAAHRNVETVRYPGFSGVISIDIRGGAEAAERVCTATQLWFHATSLGSVESTLERRRRWAAESPLVPEGLIRLSVGIEDVNDLWDDLAQALDRA